MEGLPSARHTWHVNKVIIIIIIIIIKIYTNICSFKSNMTSFREVERASATETLKSQLNFIIMCTVESTYF